METTTKWGKAAIVGLIPATLEFLLVYFADPGAGTLMLLQSVIFWFGCGVVVYLASPPASRILGSVLLTLLLNLPWYIALSIAPGKWEHLVPLVVASLVMGVIIGVVGKKL